MVVHGLAGVADCFAWIVPVILVILVRPVVIDYVHKIESKIYREVSIVGLCLIMGGIGCFIVGLSTDYSKKHVLFNISRLYSVLLRHSLVGLLWM